MMSSRVEDKHYTVDLVTVDFKYRTRLLVLCDNKIHEKVK